jgi:hypothetical protein
MNDVFTHGRSAGVGQVLGPAASTSGTTDGSGSDLDSGDVQSGSTITGGGNTVLTSGGGNAPVYAGGSTSSGGVAGSGSLTESITDNLPFILGGLAVAGGIGAVAYIAHRQKTGKRGFGA